MLDFITRHSLIFSLTFFHSDFYENSVLMKNDPRVERLSKKYITIKFTINI